MKKLMLAALMVPVLCFAEDTKWQDLKDYVFKKREEYTDKLHQTCSNEEYAKNLQSVLTLDEVIHKMLDLETLERFMTGGYPFPTTYICMTEGAIR